jgi:hypothetical protein
MTTSLHPTSAKIYQFVPRPRATVRPVRGSGQTVALRPEPPPATPAFSVDAWYHEAAMREELPGRKG